MLNPTDTNKDRIIGLPYARTHEDGSRTCPVCRERIRETFDVTGEPTSNNYAEHYQRDHGGES